MENNSLGLYIHIPFCKAKCNYCDFNSYAGMEEYIPAYFHALEKEIALYSGELRDYSIKTMYIGGGTPSYVEAKYIYEIMKLCRQRFNLAEHAEISMETNPGTLSYEKLMTYKAVGINRLSMGLQACQDSILKKLGRIHSFEEFAGNLKLAQKVGFKNINVDLIFGLPEQTLNDWSQTLSHIINADVSHLSCYSLKIEEGTVFGSLSDSGELVPAEDELDREMYYMAVDKLSRADYLHYELSNFARKGYECRHNYIYWKAEPYIGFGAGAHSYFQNRRFNNISDVCAYIKNAAEKEQRRENVEYINKEESMAEFMILGLRLVDGISADQFRARYQEDMFAVFGNKFEKLVKKELLEIHGDKVKLSDQGLDLANNVFVEFI